MSQMVTIEIPDDLANLLQPMQAELPRILELGLREVNAIRQAGFEGAADVLELFASLPTPEEIIALRPSPTLQARIHELLEKNRDQGLTLEEEEEWQQVQYLEHLVRLAKAKAHLKLQAQDKV